MSILNGKRKVWVAVLWLMAYFPLCLAAQEKEEKAPEGVKTKTENHYSTFTDAGGVPQKKLVEHFVHRYDEKGNRIEDAYYDANGKLFRKALLQVRREGESD